jgi:CheY-like chemotaxis protein
MSKIMLVEDDNNLREIYEARLLAEGYEIVAAKDGEEALAMAVKEKPDLIISDVMMPKISGFDMLDILRSTPETKDTKIIMMTALSQAEDKTRADKLGADRYLVKSQVTLEDVAKVAHDVLTGEDSSSPVVGDTPSTAAASVSEPASVVANATTSTQPEPVPAPAPPTPTPTPEPTDPVPAPDPAPPVPEPVVEAPAEETAPAPATPVTETPVTEPVSEPPADTPAVQEELTQTTASEQESVASQINAIFTEPTPEPTTTETSQPTVQEPVSETTPEPTTIAVTEESESVAKEVAPEPSADTSAPTVVTPTEPTPAAPEPAPMPTPKASTGGGRVIAPINDVNAKPSITELLAEEEAKEILTTPPPAGQQLKPILDAIEEPSPKPPAPGTNVSPNDISL